MVVSSLSPLFISPHPPPPPPPRKTLNPNKTLTISSSAYLLRSPKPRSRRKNHLRPKLPLPLKPQPGPTVPLEIETPNVEEAAAVEEEEEEEEEEESVQELTFESSQTPDPLPNPNPNPSPKSAVLGLSLRFAALLAVQTAAAVWLFSRGGGGGGGVKPDESANFDARVAENEVGKVGEAKIESDFDRLVWEIRQMAREARETEAREREGKELEKERVLMGLERDSGGGKSGSRKRLGFLRTNVVRRKSVGKGFNGAKKVGVEDNDDDNGGIRQIGRQDPLRVSPNLHESRQSAALSEMIEKTADVGEFDTSLVNGKSTEREIQVKQSFEEGEIPSSTKYRNINGRSESPAQKKEAVEKSIVKKYMGGMLDHRKKPWWLKLPFVLAVLLRKGSDGSCPKGLYSLKMNSPSGMEGSESYTIVFQDQGDATNFCYLLESFFEELDDFSANVVPLTINELEDGVKSGALKVIVVKKGQLQLYAGQPLSEIEAVLRSFID